MELTSKILQKRVQKQLRDKRLFKKKCTNHYKLY